MRIRTQLRELLVFTCTPLDLVSNGSLIDGSSMFSVVGPQHSTRIDRNCVTSDMLPLLFLKENAAQLSSCCGFKNALVPIFLTVNDDFKLRVWREDVEEGQDGQNAVVCTQTVLAPTYGGSLNKYVVLLSSFCALFRLSASAYTASSCLSRRMCFVPQPRNAALDQNYIFYSTMGKVVGLIKLPLDGNPCNSMGLIAQASEVVTLLLMRG